MSTATRTNIRDAARFIRDRKQFTAGGNAYGHSNFMGTNGDVILGVGRLSEKEREAFYAARNSGGMSYIVYSYATPIAWCHESGWHIVEQKFSSSTSRHQSAVRNALAKF